MTNDYQRQTAVRALAGELLDALYTFRESDEERAPTFSLLPTGEKANRVFIVGVLMDTEDVGTENEFWKAEIMDLTGDSYYAFAGKYQQEAAAAFERLESPAYVAMTAKVDVYETDDDGLNVSLTPESVTEVDQESRDQWVRETVAQTLDRVEAFRSGAGGPYAEMAAQQYGESVSEYVDSAVEALERLEGEEEAVGAESDSGGEPASAD